METPVLTNGRCQVLKHQCRQSNGGLYYTSYDEFESELSMLIRSLHLRRQLGRQGHQFASRHYNWKAVIAKYHALFMEMTQIKDKKSAN